MSDNATDKLSTVNRVSIRAVLVNEGEDPSAALAEAGFVETISIPVVLGEELDLSGGILGNGMTPNLTAVLETEQPDGSDASSGTQPGSARTAPDVTPDAGPVATMLPAAYGIQPLAPVRGISRAD
jgi:hypothetical protein